MSITNNLHTIKTKIQMLVTKYHRDPNAITLLAASKQQSIEKIREAIQAGQTIFGENYLQEALKKIDALKTENIEWHFIGSIQSNKTKLIAENFSWVQSVSSLEIASKLNKHRPEKLPPLNICLQVNVSQEGSKSGLRTEQDVLELAANFSQFKNLRLRGLMTIPAIKNILEEQRGEYKKLNLIYQKLCQMGYKIDTLSMGMSSDLEAAIAEGATLVRIGTDIFGKRT